MNKKELELLVDRKLITQVGYVEDLIKNPEKLEKVSEEDMAAMGVLSQPEVNTVVIEEGVLTLMPIVTQADLIERIKLGKPFKLTNDIQLDTCIVIDKGDKCEIDLNGYNITAGLFAESAGDFLEGDSDSFAFWNKGGELIISGDGNINTQAAKYSIAVWTQGGTTVLNGGVYKNAGEGSDLIYASATGSVEINGGYYEACIKQEGVVGTANTRDALNIKDADFKKGTAKIIVKGGKFIEFNPANNLSEGPNTNFVADGYKVVEDSDIYSVIKA